MSDPIGHAKAYPFPAPDHSYLFEAGDWRPLSADFEKADRAPVLAAGSNQSPEQLARKYRHMPNVGPIPAQRGVLHDFDVVYAAHLSSYGSVPATFQHSPGTAVTVFVLWLTEPQLDRMHQTEGNYSYDHLEALRLELDDGPVLPEAFAYSSKIGCLSHEGDCVSLAEITARNRRYRALRQDEMQAAIRDRLAPGMALDSFIEQHIADPAVHHARCTHLAEGALTASYRRRTLRIL